MNSHISELNNFGENLQFYITIKDSSIPTITPDASIKIWILYLLDVDISFNNNPIETKVEVYYENELKAVEHTDKNGNVIIPLIHKSISYTDEKVFENYTVETSYLGYSETKDIKLNKSISTTYNFVDNTGPEISDISFSPLNWNSNRQINVQATVKDTDFEKIGNVTIRYSTNDGANWNEIEMHLVGDDKYEGIIPGQKTGTEVEFYIVASDDARNLEKTKSRRYNVGIENVILFYTLMILLSGLFVIIIRNRYLRWRKLKNYNHKFNNKSKILVLKSSKSK
jgi:hypothetical protein